MRLEITRSTHLALRAMQELAGAGERTKGAVLATAIGTSPAFLAQVMTSLVRQGWVDSEPGRSGGYALAVDPEAISVLSLVEAVEGPTDTEGCALRGGPCSSADQCAIHDAWTQARGVLTEALETTSITSIPRQGVLL
jgi:Rrf2 family protein